MELIQFKSINGKKFNNLRFIWAAVNPDDPEDVVTLEPQTCDSSSTDGHSHIKAKYKPNVNNAQDVSKFEKTIKWIEHICRTIFDPKYGSQVWFSRLLLDAIGMLDRIYYFVEQTDWVLTFLCNEHFLLEEMKNEIQGYEITNEVQLR